MRHCDAYTAGSIVRVEMRRLAMVRTLSDDERERLAEAAQAGLLRADEKYDPARGFDFSTYATHWVRQSMQRALGIPHVRPQRVQDMMTARVEQERRQRAQAQARVAERRRRLVARPTRVIDLDASLFGARA